MTVDTTTQKSLLSSAEARQFLQFCVVGGSSFVLDTGSYVLFLKLGFPPLVAQSIGFIIGVSNGYYWNSRWTFKNRRGDARKQIPLFFATNLVGFLLNLGVSTAVLVAGAHFHWMPGTFSASEIVMMLLLKSANTKNGFSYFALIAAKVCATVVVTIWNFGASKFITFR